MPCHVPIIQQTLMILVYSWQGNDWMVGLLPHEQPHHPAIFLALPTESFVNPCPTNSKYRSFLPFLHSTNTPDRKSFPKLPIHNGSNSATPMPTEATQYGVIARPFMDSTRFHRLCVGSLRQSRITNIVG